MAESKSTRIGPNPSGICQCGCGNPAPIATQTASQFGHVKGLPVRFILGHSSLKGKRPDPPNPSGLCLCGCGKSTGLARQTHVGKGTVKGMPVRYLTGHNSTKQRQAKVNSSGFCRCGCGGKTPIATYSSRIRGTVKGMPTPFLLGHAKAKHGYYDSRTYRSWASMKSRCTNPKSTAWEYYGGRGIKVCERWLLFENFLADMGERPEGKSIDRFPDQNGNYEKDNCRWATQKEQLENRRPRRRK